MSALVGAASLVVGVVQVVAGAPPASAAQGDISTYAGGGVGDGEAATNAALFGPNGVAVDGAGNLFIADTFQHRVRKVDTSGVITTVAGTGFPGFSGDGGPATGAELTQPSGVAVDAAGNLLIADSETNRVRQVSPAGIITTVAGGGSPADNLGDGGPATSAVIVGPGAVAVDQTGSIYVTDQRYRVRKVDASGTISTVAGTGAYGSDGDGGPATAATLTGPGGLAPDGAGNLYVADGSVVRKVDAAGTITTVAGMPFAYGYGGDGGPATAAQLSGAFDVAADTAGNVFIADYNNRRVRRVDTSGIITTVAGTGGQGSGGDGGPATAAPVLPASVAVAAGNIYIGDGDAAGNGTNTARVRKVNAAGVITTVAGGGLGDGGPASAAVLYGPWGTDRVGSDLYLSEQDGNRVRKVGATGTITTLAGGTGVGDNGQAANALLAQPTGVLRVGSNLYVSDTRHQRVRKVDGSGVITTVAGNGIAGYAGDGGPATSAELNTPGGLAMDAAGALYIADLRNNRVRKVDPSGVITTIAGTGVAGFGGDGGPATSAVMNNPVDLAVDSAGDVLVTDSRNSRVRKIDPAGVMTTLAGTVRGFAGDGGPATAAKLAVPQGLAVDGADNVFIADLVNNRIRKVDAAGMISTVAGSGSSESSGDGGPATAAGMFEALDVAVDGAGNLLIAEVDRVRRVDAAGIITTVAGTGYDGYNGDGIPATSAKLRTFYTFANASVAFDPAGGFLLSDPGNDRLRAVDGAGIITTFAGGGVGDGAPAATEANLNAPRGVAVAASGAVYIADCGNHRVRTIDGSGAIQTFAGGGAAAGDGVPATSAALGCPSGLFAVTSGAQAGSLYVADAEANKVRRIDAAGVITTVAGTGNAGFGGDGGAAAAADLNGPQGVLLDAAGNLLIADSANNRVRKVDPAGVITTVAGNGTAGSGGDGGPATAAQVTVPTGMAVGPSGALYIAEWGFNKVRRVDAAGVITTVAGYGNGGFAGDGGPATFAMLDHPTQIEFSAAGDLLVADSRNNRIRRVEAADAPAATPKSPSQVKSCGQVLTKSAQLTRDIGPCSGDGVVIGADGITLDLNGYRIVGSAGPTGNVGIRLTSRHGVTIQGSGRASTTPGALRQGEVTGFDAGVAIIGGSANTVTGVNVHDNRGANNANGQFGDGIAVLFSAGNVISGNTVTGNGVYDNISVLGEGSNGNVVRNNTVADGWEGQVEFGGVGIIVNPFVSEELPRQVSVEGNDIVANTVRNNEGSGISSLANIGAEVTDNVVTGNGTNPHSFSRTGIGVQKLAFTDPVNRSLVQHNQVHGNYGDGIFVLGQENRILDNDASNNALGAGPFTAHYDLHDGSGVWVDSCVNNVWSGNVWGSGGYRPDCTSSGGHLAAGTTVAATSSAPSTTSDAVAPKSFSRGHPPKP